MFAVEKGIPAPDYRTFENRRYYPWKDMEVGDSFYVPARTDEGVTKLQVATSSTAIGAGKRLKTRYTVRQEGEGVRVWRVE